MSTFRRVQPPAETRAGHGQPTKAGARVDRRIRQLGRFPVTNAESTLEFPEQLLWTKRARRRRSSASFLGGPEHQLRSETEQRSCPA
jgi:hypothetical protein